MPRKPNANKTTRLTVSLSSEVVAYLDELARIGIHGKTASEVAKTLIGNGIERLVKDGIVRIRTK
jgi:hypothetical protein